MRGLLVFAFVMLAGCAPRGVIVAVPAEAATGAGTVQRVFVATTRGTESGSARFGPTRAATASFALYDISVPSEREPGDLTWPTRGSTPDPSRHFVTVGEARFDGAPAFRSALGTEMRAEQRGHREAVIYVHGFNNNFAEGLYRIAQLSHDLNVPGQAVHYSWPSQASPLGYAYDRDSALFARDGLEALIRETAKAGADRILLVSHSMGSGLVMESLRQIALQGHTTLLDRVAGVILISPDIDIDVFRAQALAIGRLPQPFVVFTSSRDRALQLSAVVARESARLGNLRDLRALAGLDVTLLEVGAFSTGAGHFTAATSPALIGILNGIGAIDSAFDRDQVGRIGLLPGAVLTVQGATRIVLDPFARIGEELAR